MELKQAWVVIGASVDNNTDPSEELPFFIINHKGEIYILEDVIDAVWVKDKMAQINDGIAVYNPVCINIPANMDYNTLNKEEFPD